MTVLLLRVLVVALAAYRLARALSIDSISAPLRDWLWVGVYGEDADFTTDDGEPEPVGGVFWRLSYALASCIYCAGWWIALGLYALWVNWSPSRPFIAAVAAAGAVAVLASFDSAVRNG